MHTTAHPFNVLLQVSAKMRAGSGLDCPIGDVGTCLLSYKVTYGGPRAARGDPTLTLTSHSFTRSVTRIELRRNIMVLKHVRLVAYRR